MKQRIWTVSACILALYLVCGLATADTGSTTKVDGVWYVGGNQYTPDIKIYGITDDNLVDMIINKADGNQFFKTLESNTKSCYHNCEAVYTFHNPFNIPLNMGKKGVKIYQMSGEETEYATITEKKCTTTNLEAPGISTIEPNATVTCRVRGEKTRDVKIEWIPYVCFTSDENPWLSGKATQVCISYTPWAQWGPVLDQSDTQAIYNLDEASGNALDSSSNGNDGAVTDAAYGETGVFGDAYYLDGDSAFIQANGIAATDPAGPMHATLTAWVKKDDCTLNDVIVMRGDNNAEEAWYQFYIDDGVMVTITDNGTNLKSITGTGDLCDGTWKHLAYAVDDGTGNNYINGVLNKTGDLAANTIDITDAQDFFIGRTTAGANFFNGTIDEVVYWNNTLTQAQILELYEEGLTDAVDVASSLENFWGGSGATITVSVQESPVNGVDTVWFTYNGTLGTVDTSPVNGSNALVWDASGVPVGNYTIVGFVNGTDGYEQNSSDETTLWVSVGENIRDKQLPADIDIFTLFSTLVNVSYNITSAIGVTSNTTWSSVNTTGGCYTWVNGTCTMEGNESNTYEVYGGETSNTYLYRFGENGVYPWTGNWDHDLMEDTAHTETYTTDGNVDGLKVVLYDVRAAGVGLGFLEFMAQRESLLSGPVNVYYCNSTYTTGNYQTSAACTQFASTSVDFNHSHSANSNHTIVSFPVDVSDGSIGGVGVTNASQFIFNSPTALGWTFYAIPGVTRASQMQTTGNRGSSWGDFVGTFDVHLHQYNGSEAFCYYVEACDSGSCDNSTISCDLLELGNLPPTTPNVFKPTEDVYATASTLDINWTASVSPNAYDIDTYNVTIFDWPALTVYDNLAIVDGNILGYEWDTTGVPDGMYIAGVLANDTEGQVSGDGFSANFSLADVPTVASCAVNQSTILLGRPVVVTFTAAKADTNLDRSWFTYDSSIGNNSAASDGANSLWFSTTGVGVATYTITCYTNNTAGNTGNDADGTLQVWDSLAVSYAPAATTVIAGQTTTAVNTLSNGLTISQTWVEYDGTIYGQTSAAAGANNVNVDTSLLATATYATRGCANDSQGIICTSNQSVKVIMALNATGTEEFNTLLIGKPFQAARDTMENRIDNMFWTIAFGAIFVAVWLKTASFVIPTILLDLFIMLIGGVGFLTEAWIIAASINILALGMTIWKLFSPTKTD